jgi:hypothetical protein
LQPTEFWPGEKRYELQPLHSNTFIGEAIVPLCHHDMAADLHLAPFFEP